MSRRSAVTVAMVASLAALACGAGGESPTSPVDMSGSVAGTVTLLGTAGPANPAGVGIKLYRSLEDLESRAARYQAVLVREPGVARVYRFAFPKVDPGPYYAEACFEIGCGEYRDPDSHDLRL